MATETKLVKDADPAPVIVPVATKPFYMSKTLWALAIAAAGYFLQKAGAPVDPGPNADFSQIQTYIQEVAAAKGNVSTILGIALTAIGFVSALISRIISDTKLTLTKKK